MPSALIVYSDKGTRAVCGCGKWSRSDDDSQKVYSAADAHVAKHLQEVKHGD
jgi:hypothetical protein